MIQFYYKILIRLVMHRCMCNVICPQYLHMSIGIFHHGSLFMQKRTLLVIITSVSRYIEDNFKETAHLECKPCSPPKTRNVSSTTFFCFFCFFFYCFCGCCCSTTVRLHCNMHACMPRRIHPASSLRVGVCLNGIDKFSAPLKSD